MTAHTQDKPIPAATILTYLAIMVIAAVTLGWVVIPLPRRPPPTLARKPAVKESWLKTLLGFVLLCLAGVIAAAIGVGIVYAWPM